MKKLATVATLAILTASSVSAEGFYVGAGISQERLSPVGAPFSRTSTNAIALIGYDINDMISVEAETSLPVSKDNSTESFSEITADVSVLHTAVFAKFTLPTSGSFKPFARAGMTKGTAKAEAIPSGELLEKVNDTVFSYGIGAEWALSEKFGLRVDYSMMKMSNDQAAPADVEVLALSSVYRF
ncbi:porin family protein [Amylibacter sp.]|nr:porin family protein [Amylibacter sp.]